VKLKIRLKNLIIQNPFLHFGFILTALHLTNGIVGYMYQIIMGRILHPTEFALLSSVMALFMFLSAPMSAMAMLIVRKVSALKAHNTLYYFKSLFFHVNKLIFIISIFILIFFYVWGSYFQRYLKFENIIPIYLLAFIIILGFLTTACMAFMQGTQRFILLGFYSLFGVVCKLLIGVAMVTFGLGVNGALLGVLLSMIIIYICAIPILFISLPPQV